MSSMSTTQSTKNLETVFRGLANAIKRGQYLLAGDIVEVLWFQVGVNRRDTLAILAHLGVDEDTFETAMYTADTAGV